MISADATKSKTILVFYMGGDKQRGSTQEAGDTHV